MGGRLTGRQLEKSRKVCGGGPEVVEALAEVVGRPLWLLAYRASKDGTVAGN